MLPENLPDSTNEAKIYLKDRICLYISNDSHSFIKIGYNWFYKKYNDKSKDKEANMVRLPNLK